MAAIPSSRHIVRRLEREWATLSRSPEALAHARQWPLGAGSFASLDELLRRTGYGSSSDPRPVDNALLARLVEIAGTDDLAARVVLQRLLPGVRALARRNAVVLDQDAQESLDEAISAAWLVIRLYPCARRTGFVASTLLHDIEYVAFRRARRRKVEVVPEPISLLDVTPALDEPRDAHDELAELLDDARQAGFAPEDVDLLERLGDGATPIQLAVERHVTERTIRNHRRKAVDRLRQLALSCA